VLNIFGAPVPRQRFVERRDAKARYPSMFDKRHARTARLAQSILATRLQKAERHRNIVMSLARHDWAGDAHAAQQIGIDPVAGRGLLVPGRGPAPRSPSRASAFARACG